MLTTAMLSALLMLGGLGRTASSDLQVYGKSVHRDQTFLSSNDGRHPVMKQPHQQTKAEIQRSLDLESFNVHVMPTTSKISLPSIIKLYPPTAKPLHRHTNMPMRFGRESSPGEDRAPNSNSNSNMPQRFGRSWEMIRMCAECPSVREASSRVLPQRFGSNIPDWRLLRTLAIEQILNAGLRWAEDFDFTTGSEEVVETKEKTFKRMKEGSTRADYYRM